MASARPWWQTAVIYQLYVRSFADADGDGIGDLRGIRQHLDHLEALGIEAIWLNPCYPSPQADHGYDVSDYFDIEPAYGDLPEFDALVADARTHGIRILMDVVPNHCSEQHPWFRAALAAGPGSPERDRFYFRDGRGPAGDEPPNNWRSVFAGPAWTRVTEADGSPGQWYLHAFTPQQPDFNWSNPEIVEHFDRMLRFWFDRGVEGFRADAVAVVGKAPGLPDEERPSDAPVGTRNPYLVHRPEGFGAWRHWREVVDQYERDHPGRELFIVAEAYTPKRPDLARQYANRHGFHQVFAFDLLLSPWRADSLRRAIQDTLDAVTPTGVPAAWTLNNHDAQRVVTRYGRADATETSSYTGDNLRNSQAPVDVETGTHRARAGALLELALPGSVYLYAGEELGLPEVLDIPDSAREDPIFFRTGGRVPGRDGCRVPLPWTRDAAGSFGFSPRATTASPWLPQPDDWGAWAADVEAEDAASMLSLYRAAVAVRRRTDALRLGGFEWIDVAGDLLAFRRDDVVVVLNAGRTDAALAPDVVGDRQVLISSRVGHRDAAVVPGDTCAWLGGAST
jgi:alpha-glucosidase